MSKYLPHIKRNADGRFYALVVRLDAQGQGGESQIDPAFKPRHFGTYKAAEKATSAYIAKLAA